MNFAKTEQAFGSDQMCPHCKLYVVEEPLASHIARRHPTGGLTDGEVRNLAGIEKLLAQATCKAAAVKDREESRDSTAVDKVDM